VTAVWLEGQLVPSSAHWTNVATGFGFGLAARHELLLVIGWPWPLVTGTL